MEGGKQGKNHLDHTGGGKCRDHRRHTSGNGIDDCGADALLFCRFLRRIRIIVWNAHFDKFGVHLVYFVSCNDLKLILMPVYSGNFRKLFDIRFIDLTSVFYIKSQSCHAVENAGDIIFAAQCLNQFLC